MLLLGVDFGTVRVGLATLDTSVGFALPLRSIDAAPMRELADDVASVAAKEGASQLVVGVPVALQGQQGDEALGQQGRGKMHETVLQFVEVLRAATALPVATEDERMTSAMVESARRQAGAQKGQVDKDAMAAALILETYAARHKLV
jgi:putative Holliday junction resolvase